MVKLIWGVAMVLGLAGCSHTPRESPQLPNYTTPSSASERPAELTNDEVKYLKKDRTGKIIGRKFDKNQRNLKQSNRWINWKYSNEWFWKS